MNFRLGMVFPTPFRLAQCANCKEYAIVVDHYEKSTVYVAKNDSLVSQTKCTGLI